VKKYEIIQQILEQHLRDESVGNEEHLCRDSGNKEEVIATLEASLQNADGDDEIRTCADFKGLNIECCETCHTFYPEDEMALLDVEAGGNAWLCCAMGRALNPLKQAAFEQSEEYRMIDEILGLDYKTSDQSR
jgi:hypothetical protein